MGDLNQENNGAPVDAGLSTEDLEKSIQKLEEVATTGDAPSRKEQLLEKAKTEELEKSEQDELFALLGGTPDEGTTIGDDLVKGFEDNEPLQKALDVSDFLKEQHDELCKSLQAVGEKIEESDNRRHEFNLVMAKAVRDIGVMVKSMAESFEGFAAAPARAPKSKGTPQPKVLEKGFANQEPDGEQLSKGQILGALSTMAMTQDKVGGENVQMAVAKYEQTNRISPQVYNEVKQFVANRGAQ